MGLHQLPDELLFTLTEQWACREQQLRQLSVLLHPRLPSPSTIVAYGTHATGKSEVTKAYLEASKLRHAIIRCRECVTGRHLLERTVAAVYQALHAGEDAGDEAYDSRCENIAALAVHLERLLFSRQEKFILVFDSINAQRDAPPTLLPALARLGELIPSLTILLIVQHPPPRFLHQTGIPHIQFSAYTRQQCLTILARSPSDIFLLIPPADDQDYDEEVHTEDKAWLWPRFCAAVWDSLAQNAARDFAAFRDLCHKLWRPFVAPILKGDFGTRDFSRLLVSQRRLFQDETILLHSLISSPTAEASTTSPIKRPTHDLPYYAAYALCAAYLASFNPARLDALYFMKATERKRRKKGGGTARSGVRASQTRKISRHLLAASAFTLDRLLAILHAILPHEMRSTVDVYTQIATLTGLKLLVGGGDALEAGGKWRVGPLVGWEYIQGVARGVDFGIVDYVAE